MKKPTLCDSASVISMLALALALGAADSAHAQWGGGYGYGGWGWGGYGGMGAMGMSLYDQAMVKNMYWEQGAASYNMMNAQAAQSYSSANLMQQQAMNTALQNQQLAQQLAQDKYNLYNQQKNNAIEQARAAAPRVPLTALVNRDGSVNWPEVAPSGGAHADRRTAADRAVKSVYEDYRRSGHATLSNVFAAKSKLQSYGEPALTLLRARNDTRGRSQLLGFLQSLDSALDTMGNPPQDDAPAPRGRSR